ncbi:MAG: glycoside hydrolase family 13 protein [Ruminococcaceae bacterium]|nr:glycoside hydrolase family 13 protein [Oscillospiraceae bacterium]
MQRIAIVKTVDGKDVSFSSSFAVSVTPKITLRIPRALNIVEPSLVICKDGQRDKTVLPTYDGENLGSDIFTFTLDLKKLCEEEDDGLFYYEFRFAQNGKTLYTSSINNVDFNLSEHPARRFILLVYEDGFKTPENYYGTTMYHIFVDRFAKSEKKLPLRADAILREDWDTGIPEFAPYPGAPLKNNQFFGGSLWGIIEKLDYLESLSVNCLYLSPIFKAYSNHKYDTGNYLEIDEMFGGQEAFNALLSECKKRGIKVILDGVFNHTGDDSIYFNRYGKYPSVGAYQSEKSPYAEWYHFLRFPNKYDSWWGIEILPRLNHSSRECRNYFVGKNGVCENYINKGINGWRLDVADELSDVFLDSLRDVVKAANPDAIVIGEVWENAAEKVAYGTRRRYLRGKQLDSVMNYPTKNAIINFIKSGDCAMLYNTVTELYSCYPKAVCDCLMNLLGTHDTERIMTALVGRSAEGLSNEELSKMRMSPDEKSRGIAMLKMASAIQYTLYGFPSVFYGDEAGMEGYRDPFCRMPYPWGRECKELVEHYKALGKIRKEHSAYAGGDFKVVSHDGGLFAFVRGNDKEKILTVCSRVSFPVKYEIDGKWRDAISGETGEGAIMLAPDTFRILELL